MQTYGFEQIKVTAIRVTELAPAITEANWDTSGAGFVHPLVGGIIDKFEGGDGAVTTTTPISVSIGDIFEINITAVNSPTTGTFVGPLTILIGGAEYNIDAAGNYTNTIKAISTDTLYIVSDESWDTRFGISAISVKKLTEGNLTMDGGQIKAQTFAGNTPGFAAAEAPTTGLCVGTGVCKVVVGGTQVVDFVGGIPTAANDAAAATAGVPVGGFYRSNADPSVVCVRTA